MKILHIVKTHGCEANGVMTAVANYIKFESKNNKVALYNLDEFKNSNAFHIFNNRKYKTISELPSPYNNPDIVVFNEVYKIEYIHLYKECLRRKVKYVIIPHGSLMKRAQKNKFLKKKIANIFLFGRFIKKASALQFLSNEERDKSIFKSKRFIISGNGIEIPKRSNNPLNKNLIFIGRYDVEVKGLDILSNLVYKYKRWFIDNQIIINLYGTSTAKQIELLNKIIKEKNISEIIHINGPVFNKEKESIICDAFGYIQLSRHEGMPMSIIESLGYGLPCIVSKGTNFAEFVEKNRCGLPTNYNIDFIFKKIKELYSNKENRNCMSINAKKAIEENFDFEKIINIVVNEYKKL